jgi:hypothetical protein
MVTLGLAGALMNTAGFFTFYITVAVLGGLQILDYMLRTIRSSPAAAFASRQLGDA